jgi:hypothetical protein
MLSTSTSKSITKYEPVNSERRKRQKNASQIHSQNRQYLPVCLTSMGMPTLPVTETTCHPTGNQKEHLRFDRHKKITGMQNRETLQ